MLFLVIPFNYCVCVIGHHSQLHSDEDLDVSHTGLAIHRNGELHFLHASLGSKEVEITRVPLSEYLKGLGNVSGIIVARVYNQ